MIEDIFEESLVDGPDDIERVIEGGGEDLDRGSDDDEKKKDQEAKEEEKQKTKRKLGPRPVLNAQRLKGPRGISTIEGFFADVKLDERRGCEKKNLDIVMKRLELWTHRLYPKGQFDDCLKKIEKLGTNKLVKNHMKRIVLGMEDGSSDMITEEPNSPPPVALQEDPFDQLVSSNTELNVPDESDKMTTEQRQMMLSNRLIAEERRVARIKKAQELKERFRAQQASSLPEAIGDMSLTQLQTKITQEQQEEKSVSALQMEVDDPETIRLNTDETFALCRTIAEQILDDVEQKVASSQRKNESSNKENAVENHVAEQNERKTAEEMEIGELCDVETNLTTSNDVVFKENCMQDDIEITTESHLEIKGKDNNISNDHKENENPN